MLGIERDDLVSSAAKLFFAYGLGNAMTVPMSVGASSVKLPGRPTADAVLEVKRTHQPSVFSGVPTVYASLLEILDGTGSTEMLHTYLSNRVGDEFVPDLPKTATGKIQRFQLRETGCA